MDTNGHFEETDDDPDGEGETEFVKFDTFYMTKRYEFMGLPAGRMEENDANDTNSSVPMEEMWVDWS